MARKLRVEYLGAIYQVMNPGDQVVTTARLRQETTMTLKWISRRLEMGAWISRARLLDPANRDPGRPVVWSHPAFANQCVYARNDKEMVCVSAGSGVTRAPF